MLNKASKMIGIKVIEIEQNSTADLVILDENNNTEYLDSIYK